MVAVNGAVKEGNGTVKDSVLGRKRKRSAVRAERVRLRDKKFVGCSSIDEYELNQMLGSGTFGKVYKGKHKATGDHVALKEFIMHNEKDGFPLTSLREIRFVKALRHPSIVPIYDMAFRPGNPSIRTRGSIFMVFPYMDHDLAGLLRNPAASFTVSQIKLYMKQLLEGTFYLHSHRILHRDMKAANLLISNDGTLKIADFGLARSFHDPENMAAYSSSQSTSDGWAGPSRQYTAMVVTRWYRPPEVLMSQRDYGPAIDMWGIGCILGEMFERQPILQGESDTRQLELIWDLCGTPDVKDWPKFFTLPGINSQQGIPYFVPRPRRIREKFDGRGTQACDLIDKLLTLNPDKRITAREALDHEWLWEDPLPADPTTLPIYEPSKELDRPKADSRARLPPPAPVPGAYGPAPMAHLPAVPPGPMSAYPPGPSHLPARPMLPNGLPQAPMPMPIVGHGPPGGGGGGGVGHPFPFGPPRPGAGPPPGGPPMPPPYRQHNPYQSPPMPLSGLPPPPPGGRGGGGRPPPNMMHMNGSFPPQPAVNPYLASISGRGGGGGGAGGMPNKNPPPPPVPPPSLPPLPATLPPRPPSPGMRGLPPPRRGRAAADRYDGGGVGGGGYRDDEDRARGESRGEGGNYRRRPVDPSDGRDR